MQTILPQILGLAILAAGVAACWLRWRGAAGPATFTVILTLVGGFAGAPFWWMDYPASFSWDLPPLASRMLAAAGLAFGVGGILVLEHPSVPRTRAYLAMLATYLAPLVAAIVIFHLDRFDWRAPITYAFFAIAAGLTVASFWHLLNGPRAVAAGSVPSPAQRALFTVIATLAALWGLALYILPAGPLAFIWIWPADALSGRLIGTMLLTIAVLAFLARNSRDLASPALVILAVYGLGAAMAGAMNLAAGKPLPVAYVAALGAMGIAAAILRLMRPAAV